jgi:hypothetical protein
MIMDISYTTDKMFTRFMPESKAGEDVWREMASKMDGVAAVLNFEAARVIAEMRKAGYKVAKAKSVNLDMSDDELLAALGI